MFVADGRVHQVQIDVVQSKVRQTPATRSLDVLRVVMDVPQLRNDENFLAFHFAGRNFLVDGFSDLRLVLVEESGVDVPVASFESELCGVVAIVVNTLDKKAKQLISH